jgi:hypothetical protein
LIVDARFLGGLRPLQVGDHLHHAGEDHLDGTVKSVELASLGRRAAETEIELVELMERS